MSVASVETDCAANAAGSHGPKASQRDPDIAARTAIPSPPTWKSGSGLIHASSLAAARCALTARALASNAPRDRATIFRRPPVPEDVTQTCPGRSGNSAASALSLQCAGMRGLSRRQLRSPSFHEAGGALKSSFPEGTAFNLRRARAPLNPNCGAAQPPGMAFLQRPSRPSFFLALPHPGRQITRPFRRRAVAAPPLSNARVAQR